MDRVIGHIDLDYFYAQVEEVEDPSLKGRPVVVCVFSGRTEDSGVVSTANYLARDLGVHSGMTIVLAKKKLTGKDPAVIRMDHEKYEVVSARIMEQVEQLVDLLEPTGIDEAFFDITNSSGGDYAKALATAESIKDSILKSEHLTCSVGLGRSKVVAKLCSDMAKPGGLKAVHPDETERFLTPLPASKLYGVGPKTNTVLEQMGISTVGQLAKVDPVELEQRIGKKFTAYLIAAAKGSDMDPVVSGLEPTQFSRIVTLKLDTRDPNEVIDQLSEGIQHVHQKLVSSGMSFRTVSAIAVLSDLSTKTKSKTFETPMNELPAIRDSASVLFGELTKGSGRGLRRAGIRVSGLEAAKDQTSLSEFVRQSRGSD